MTTAAAPRRRRWLWVVIGLVMVLAALIVAAELIARSVVPSTVRSLVIENLDLPTDQQIDVEVPGMMLPQLIKGTLDEVTLSSREVRIGGVTGAAHVEATGVPVHGGELTSAAGTVSIDESEFTTLLTHSALPGAEITLSAPDVTMQIGIPILGRDVPVGITVTPGAEDGDLLLTPVSLRLGGSSIDVHSAAGLLGEIGTRLAQTQRICIADRLPAGITLTGLRIEGSRAVVDIAADGRITVDESLLANGTCPR